NRRSARFAFVLCNVSLGICTSLSYVYYFKPYEYYPETMLVSHIKQNLVPGARVLDVRNVLFRNTAIAYSIPSMTNHWFSPSEIRNLVQRVNSEAPNQGLTLDYISGIDEFRAWPLLREMHVQFVSLPCAEFRGWGGVAIGQHS